LLQDAPPSRLVTPDQHPSFSFYASSLFSRLLLLLNIADFGRGGKGKCTIRSVYNSFHGTPIS
jgi:hypothetical protein